MWGPDNQLAQSVLFRGAFDGSKRYLQLAYEPPKRYLPLECDKRIVVCDGSDLFVSEFSDRIRPVGAQASVYEQHRLGLLQHVTFGFPSDLKKLATGVLSPETLDRRAVQMERLPNGHYLGRYEVSPTYHTTFEVAPEQGHNCILAESYSRAVLVYRWTVSWELTDDLWYATGGKKEKYTDGKHVETYEWQFDEFQANVPVSSDLFTLNALELPQGARILDRRPSQGTPVAIPGKPGAYIPKAYKMPDTAQKVEGQKADRLAEQIEAMRSLYEPRQVPSAWPRRTWAVAIGILGLLAIALIWFFYQRKARSGTGGG